MTGEHLGKAILCLSCDNFVITPKHYQDTIYKHVISVDHTCVLGLYPKDAMDDRGNVVADYCNERIPR